MNESGILLKSGTNEMELLAVIIDDQIFGINVAKVQSIQQYDSDSITPLPKAVPGVLGMLLYRNRTIPVMDLSKILEIEVNHNIDREIVVVTEFNNAVNGFKVQGVKRIYRLSWDELIPLDQTFGSNNYFTGTVNIEDTQILVLDLEHILSKIFPELIIEEISEENLSKKETLSRDQLKIVFADDSPTIRSGVMRALKKAGFSDVQGFVNGAEALKYLKHHYVDGERNVGRTVLISDIEMPKIDGLTLCKYVKEDKLLGDIYVIMFSSLINKQMIAKCQNVKADTYVTKPETNRLIKLLDQFCSEKSEI